LYGLALGIAVAVWGVGYKMEQFPLHDRTYRMLVPAKLLTEKERPQRVSGSQTGLAPAEQWPTERQMATWIVGIRSSALQAEPPGVLLVSAARHCKIVVPEFTYFFFRPPPSRFNP
jgi:hypothetical protein